MKKSMMLMLLTIIITACSPVAPRAPITAPTWTTQPTYTPYPTQTPYPTYTPGSPQPPRFVQSLSEFENSPFCQTYNCRFDSRWSLRRGGINNSYDLGVTPDVQVEVATLDRRPVDFGLIFYDRRRLDSNDFNLIYAFLNSIRPGADVAAPIRDFIEQNVETDVFQICEANSIPFSEMRIWAGKVIQQTISVGESCP